MAGFELPSRRVFARWGEVGCGRTSTNQTRCAYVYPNHSDARYARCASRCVSMSRNHTSSPMVGEAVSRAAAACKTAPLAHLVIEPKRRAVRSRPTYSTFFSMQPRPCSAYVLRDLSGRAGWSGSGILEPGETVLRRSGLHLQALMTTTVRATARLHLPQHSSRGAHRNLRSEWAFARPYGPQGGDLWHLAASLGSS